MTLSHRLIKNAEDILLCSVGMRQNPEWPGIMLLTIKCTTNAAFSIFNFDCDAIFLSRWIFLVVVYCKWGVVAVVAKRRGGLLLPISTFLWMLWLGLIRTLSAFSQSPLSDSPVSEIGVAKCSSNTVDHFLNWFEHSMIFCLDVPIRERTKVAAVWITLS